MAYFRSEGLDAVIAEMDKMRELAGPTADKMLQAGADKMVSQWKYEIKAAKHIDTGDLINSIKRDKTSIRTGDTQKITIYASGSSRSGKKKIRNAYKAFLTNYGTSGEEGSHWVDKAEAHATNKVTAAMTEIWEKFIEEGGAVSE